MRDIEDRWMQDIHVRGRCLRVFLKPWAMPYRWFKWGFWAFGAGPFGFMYWSRKRQGAAKCA